MSAITSTLRVLAVSHAAVVEVNQEPFDALARAGSEVILVTPRVLTTDIRGTVEFAPLEGFGGSVVCLPTAIGGYRRLLGGQRGIHLIWYRGLERTIARERPQVVFVEEEPFSLAAWQVARACAREGIPFVVHENQNVERRLPQPFRAIRKKVLRAAAGATVRSAAAADLLRAAGFTGPIASFPHAVDPTRYHPQPVESGMEHPVVGFVGRLVPEKGILDLVEAVAQLRGTLGRGSLLAIGDGPLADRAEALALERDVPARFVGALAHELVPAWYPTMDVAAVPSKTTPTWKEQFGRIVIEANAAAVPVVVSDSGELPATVEATGGGLVFPEGDVEALRDSLAGLWVRPSQRRKLGRAGRKAVEKRFTPEAVARDLQAFLAEVGS